MTNESMEKALSRNTSITLGLLILILGGVVAGTWWLAHLDAWTKRTDDRLLAIEDAVRDGTSDRWHGSDMARWVELLQKNNPDIDVPTPAVRNP